jgi:hypothetical protein
MSLTDIAILGILLGFVFLVVGFLMEGPQLQAEPTWNKAKQVHKKSKKRVSRVTLQKKAA